jgi:hypothetical protein
LTPWQLALSRSFLIDAQCLFFSLLFLVVGIYAVRKDSFKLFMFSGTLFAVALLTKLFAVFMLLPLALFYVYHRRENLSRVTAVAAYFLPAVLFFVLWYQVISGRGILSAVGHDDFSNFNSLMLNPSIFFLGNFLAAALGLTFVAAAVISLFVCFLGRKIFARILFFDLMCVATIVVVGGVNVFLAIGLNLVAPYFNPIKYDYQFLPFLSLLAASLIGKSVSLFASIKSKEKLEKLLFFASVVGLVLLAAAMFLNMAYVHEYSTWDHWIFKVDNIKNVGYSFINLTPIGKDSFLMGVQNLGFAFVIFGLVWASKEKLGGWLRRLHLSNVFS